MGAMDSNQLLRGRRRAPAKTKGMNDIRPAPQVPPAAPPAPQPGEGLSGVEPVPGVLPAAGPEDGVTVSLAVLLVRLPQGLVMTTS